MKPRRHKFNINDVVRAHTIFDLESHVDFRLGHLEKRICGFEGIIWKYPDKEDNVPKNWCLVLPKDYAFSGKAETNVAIFFAEEELELLHRPVLEPEITNLVRWIEHGNHYR